MPDPPKTFNDEQQKAFDQVAQAIQSKKHQTLLLYGITGSGKTEIYLQAVEKVLLQEQGTALMLVPEISLTPQTIERFKARFALRQAEVAVLHSRLSSGERSDEWNRIREGKARIVIGARSALFAPLSQLKLIIVDEEHDSSYKQDQSPRYHARDMAIVRSSIENCPILLGSATPSLESYRHALQGKYQLLELKSRVSDQVLPLVRVVNMGLEKSVEIISFLLL